MRDVNLSCRSTSNQWHFCRRNKPCSKGKRTCVTLNIQTHRVGHKGTKMHACQLGIIAVARRRAVVVQEASRGWDARELSRGYLPLGLHRTAAGVSLVFLAHVRRRGLCRRRRRCQRRRRYPICTQRHLERSWRRRRPRSGGMASSSPLCLLRAVNTQTGNAFPHTTDAVLSSLTTPQVNGRKDFETCPLQHLLHSSQAVGSLLRGISHQRRVEKAKGSALLLCVGELVESISTRLHLSFHLRVLLALHPGSFDANRAALEAAVASAAAAAATTPAPILVRRRVTRDVHARGVAAVGGAAELVTLPQYAPSRDPLAVRHVRLEFTRLVDDLVLIAVR